MKHWRNFLNNNFFPVSLPNDRIQCGFIQLKIRFYSGGGGEGVEEIYYYGSMKTYRDASKCLNSSLHCFEKTTESSTIYMHIAVCNS